MCVHPTLKMTNVKELPVSDVKLEKEASEREDEEMITTSLEEQKEVKEVKKEGDVDLKKEEEVTEEEEEGSYMDLEEDFAQGKSDSRIA